MGAQQIMDAINRNRAAFRIICASFFFLSFWPFMLRLGMFRVLALKNWKLGPSKSGRPSKRRPMALAPWRLPRWTQFGRRPASDWLPTGRLTNQRPKDLERWQLRSPETNSDAFFFFAISHRERMRDETFDSAN